MRIGVDGVSRSPDGYVFAMGIVCSGPPKNLFGLAMRSKNSAFEEVVLVRLSDNGFSPSHLVVHKGQCIRLEWTDESVESSKGFNVVQVAGLELDPVPGGYNSGRQEKTGSYNMCLGKTGHFSFCSESLPVSKTLTVNVLEKPIVEIKITGGGFEPEFVEILEGDAVRWSCDVEESTLPSICYIQEIGYCFEHSGFLSKKARVDVSPRHERTFQDTGMYYFCLEKCGIEEKSEESLALNFGCAIRVIQRNREFTVHLSDEGLQPNFILANVNDRIWLDCSSGNKKCGKILDACVFMDTNGTNDSSLVTAKLSDSSSPSRIAELVSHRFLEPGLYHYVYEMADFSQLIGCVVVLPTPKEHLIEIKGGEFRPTLDTVHRGERVWWSFHEKQKRESLPYLKEVETCVVPNPLSARRKSQRGGCPCNNRPQLQSFVSSLGLLTHTFEDTGVFTYQIQDSSCSSSSSCLCSVVVQPNVKHHIVRVHDRGFTPNIVNVHPRDFVWWHWKNTTRLHNIRQVSHQRTLIRDGFHSGDKTCATGAFRNRFTDLGVFYFASNGLPEVFGAVVVTPEPQVHKLLVSDRGIVFDPLVIATNDCVCWLWKSDELYSVLEVSKPDEINSAEHHSLNRNSNIRCYTRLFIKPGIYHFLCTAHDQDVENHSFLHTVLVDPVSYSCMVGLSSEGFKPSALTIEKSQSVLWTWKDQGSEKHNIIHVRPPQVQQNLIRVRGLSAFDSGPVTTSSTFFHTFDVPGTYYITSEGTNQELCVIDVLEKPLRVSSPEISDTEKNGGNVECGYRVFLKCDTEHAEVFYTTDGSFPVEFNPNLLQYEDETGIFLSWPGFVIIRAVAKKKGLLTSGVFTSKRFWVLEFDDALQKESEEELEPVVETGSVEEDLREEILRWHWLSCKPYISVTLVCDNTFHIDISLGNAADVSWIRGFQVLLNYTAYGGWFNSQCRGVIVSGLIGGKVYHMALVAYPTQDSFEPQLSNEVVISCPAVSSSGGPLVSLEVTTSPQSLVIVWPCSVDATSFGAATYSVFINGQLFGEQIVPDPESDYCRVLFESSSTNEVYTLCVACHVFGAKQLLCSNEVEFSLPVPEEIVRALQKPSHDIDTGEISTEIDELDAKFVSRELLLVVERTSFETSQGAAQPPIEKLCLKSLVNKLETIPEGQRLELSQERVSVQDCFSAVGIDEARVFENAAVKGQVNSTTCDQGKRLEGDISKQLKEVVFAADQENVLASESNSNFTMDGKELLINGVLSAEENNSDWDQGVVLESDTVHASFVAEDDLSRFQDQPSVIHYEDQNLTGFDNQQPLSSTCQGANGIVSPVEGNVDVIMNEKAGVVSGEGNDETTRVGEVFPSVQNYQQIVSDEDNRNHKSNGEAQDIGSRTGLDLNGHVNGIREECTNILPGYQNSGSTEDLGEPAGSKSDSESEQDGEKNEDVVGAVNFEGNEQNNGVLRLEEDFERISKENVSKGFASKEDGNYCKEANGDLQTNQHPRPAAVTETNEEPPMDTWSATSSHGSNDEDGDSVVVAPAAMMDSPALHERDDSSIGVEPVSLVGTGNLEFAAEGAHFSADRDEGKSSDGNEKHCIVPEDANEDKAEQLLPRPLLVVKGTTSTTVTLEWEWMVPPEQMIDTDIVYSVFILGGKFHGNINSDFCYNFEKSPAKSMWPNQGVPLQQHSWRTTNTVIEITGLKQRCRYRLAVLGQLMPSARDSLSRVITFTMPGPPRSPVIHVTALQDREVTLSWKAPRGFGEAAVVGYRVLKNGEVYGEDLGYDTARTTVSELETGKDHRVSVVAVTGHSVGDSKPSNVITIHCPTPPSSPQIYPKKTTALGSVRVAWSRTEFVIASNNEESAQFSFAVFVDGRLHGECPLDTATDIFTEENVYTIPNCEMDRKYQVYVKSYAHPRIIDDGRGGKLFVCGCYGDSSNKLELYCAGPPSAPIMWVSRIDCSGVTLRWERSREYGGVSLAGYRLYVDGASPDDLLPPECQETTLTGLTLGTAIRAQLAAVTYDLAGPIPEFNNQASDTSRYFRPFSDPTDSGVESSTSFWSKGSADDSQHACVMGSPLVVQYSNLVRKMSSVEVTEVACRSALVTWSFEETADRFVEPECFNLLCWKKGESMDSAGRHLVTGLFYIVRDLDPGNEYLLILECTASHPNDTRQGTPINISLSSVATFKTGYPPDPPENLHVVSSSEQSVKLAWKAPVERGAAVEMLHLNVITVDRSSSDLDMNFQLSPETRAFTVDFLAARTEYMFTLKALTKDDLLEINSTSQCSLTSVSAWTNGVEPAEKLTLRARTPTSLLIGWQPSVPSGMSFVKHYQLHYVENRLIRSRSRGKVGEVKDAGKKLWIESDCCEAEMEQLEPGTVYRIVIETVAGVADYSYEDDFEGDDVETASTVSSGPSFKTSEAEILCLSEPLLVCTAAPPEPPVLLVSGFTPTQIHLSWNKPLLVQPVVESKSSFAVDQARGRVRSLRAYRLEVNGRVYAKLAANRTSFVVKKCKSGMKYTCVVVVMTGPEQFDGSRRKHETADATINDSDTDEDNAISLSGCFEEAASKPVEVSLPRQDWGVSLSATYCANKPAGSLRDSPCSESGDEEGGVVVRWSLAGVAGNANGFRLVWYSSESDERNEVFLPSDASCYEIWSVLPRVVYTAFLEILDDREGALAVFGPVHCQTPGPPSSPWIWCRSLSPYQFVVEWNEPVTYGGVAIRGYQVLLNNRRLDKTVERKQRRVTLHCQSSSVYRVSVIALSSDALLGESPPSNVLKVCTPVALEGTMRGDPAGGVNTTSFGITVHVLSTSNSSIEFEWNHSPEEVHTADHYVIKWSSVLQPQTREVSLSLLHSSHVIDDCSPGTSHFIVVAAVKAAGDLVSRSEQYTIQTSAPVEKPKLQLRSCLQSGITLEWIKPTSFGDANIECFVLLVNDDLQEELQYDCFSYKFAACEPCKQYSFKLKAISTKPECDSDWSDPLIATCPGAEKPVISRIPSKMVNCIRVGWETLTLRGGARVENYKVYYLEDRGEVKTTHDVITDSRSVVHGPLPRYTEQDKLVNVPSDPSYWVVLQAELSLDCQPVCSLPIRTRSAVSPDPPEVCLEVEGLEQRTWLEKRICELTNKKDRLHRVVHLLENSVVVKGSKRKDLQISGATDAMLEVDSELADALEEIKNYTGTVSVVLRWPRPSDDGDAIVSGYQVFVNGDRYGKALSKSAMLAQVQLPVTVTHHVIAVQTLTDHPVGPSPLSFAVKVTGEEFLPFVLFCYFDVHKRGKSWPDPGCCSWEDSHSYEQKQRKKTSPRVFVPRGILSRRIPCPICSVIDVFSARWRPVAPIGVAKMAALLFWSKWCLSSQKALTFFMKFADEFKEQFSFMTCCVRSDDPIMSHRQSLAEIIAERGWDRAGQHVLHLCGCYSQHGQRARSARPGVIRDPDVCQLFGLLGTPTIVLLDSTGYISWHGRCCCRDASSFRTFLLHAFSQVSKSQCPVSCCEHCDFDAQDGQRTSPESDDESNGFRTEELWDGSAELNCLYQRLHRAARPDDALVTVPSPARSQTPKGGLRRPKITSTAANSTSGYNAPGRSKEALRTHSRSLTSQGRVTPRLAIAARHRSMGELSPSICESSSGDASLPITRRRGKRTLSQQRGTTPRVKTKISVDDFTLA